jgi:hypothetical protein
MGEEKKSKGAVWFVFGWAVGEVETVGVVCEGEAGLGVWGLWLRGRNGDQGAVCREEKKNSLGGGGSWV